MSDPCPATGLTAKERALINSSWDIVIKDPAGNGAKVFLKLFELQPSYQQLFPFKDVPSSELPQSASLVHHGNVVVGSFDNIIKALSEPAKLVDLINKFGAAHTQRGVDTASLKVFKEALLSVLALQGDELAAWNKCLDYLVKKLNDAVVEAKK